ncbi:MAG: hypothetical protein ABIP03_12465 [Aquihabitans sp.]
MRDVGMRDLTINRGAIVELCRQFGVRTLTAFGTGVAGDESPGAPEPGDGELHFVADIGPVDDLCRMDSFVGLKASLELLLGRPVQLLGPVALQDPDVVEAILHTGCDLYQA